MGHSNVWNSHPKNYGPGSRVCFVCSSISELQYFLYDSWDKNWCSPGVREPSWTDQEVRAHVLQTVLPQQRQGHRLHQVPLKSSWFPQPYCWVKRWSI
ncbi:hypothetical protein OsJ_36239 [Oryza sativa Japonica Group]|uniref:Uncharacterized protein n=1 Tax=Oryza sativa subsp. japonica TaxID=39947 RepID=A3CHR1_ORYSJ|nr:hypothetical protein OsJ_36239 [Oryza sativa Japonica Group]